MSELGQTSDLDIDTHAALTEFEPVPRIGVIQAAQRYWYLVAAPVIVFVVIAGIVASARAPTYTAEARLMVGRLNLSTAGAVQGFAGAAQDLAQSYPLAITADGVVDPLAKRFGTTPTVIRSRVSASDVPLSSIVRITATGTSAHDAIALVNASSDSLTAFLTKYNRDNPDVRHLRGLLQAAEVKLQADQAAAPPLVQHPATPFQQRAIATLASQRAIVNAIAANYQSSVLTQAVSSLLQPLVSAHTATSDRTSKLQIAVFAALVAGLVVGLALATLRANKVARMALMAPAWSHQGNRAEA